VTDPLLAVNNPTALVELLHRRGETVATAESLTAGLLAATLAGVPGVSAVLRGGLVVYSSELKVALAKVDAAVLAAHGAVSEAVAAQLAVGAAEVCGASWGIGVTGVAGPASQEGHPPGTVFVGISGQVDGGHPAVRKLLLTGDRWAVRSNTVATAIGMLQDLLNGNRWRGP
jgi:nicotinamide-nucleotide amidase